MTPADAIAVANVIESLHGQVPALRAEVSQGRARKAWHQPEEEQASWSDKYFRADRFIGIGFTNWAGDVKAWLLAKRSSYGRALDWAEDQKDERIEAGDVDVHGEISEAENRGPQTYLMFHTAQEPMVIVKACREKRPRGMDTAKVSLRLSLGGYAGGSHAEGIPVTQDHRHEELPPSD